MRILHEMSTSHTVQESVVTQARNHMETLFGALQSIAQQATAQQAQSTAASMQTSTPTVLQMLQHSGGTNPATQIVQPTEATPQGEQITTDGLQSGDGVARMAIAGG